MRWDRDIVSKGITPLCGSATLKRPRRALPRRWWQQWWVVAPRGAQFANRRRFICTTTQQTLTVEVVGVQFAHRIWYCSGASVRGDRRPGTCYGRERRTLPSCTKSCKLWEVRSPLCLQTMACDGHSGGRLSILMGWNWEQGRLEYFQFDELRKIARFGASHDLRAANRRDLAAAVGLPFLPDDDAYPPWRNYGRLFQIAMIATPRGRRGSHLTCLGELLSKDGQVTTDDYLHFLARATTQPSPALSGWDHTAPLRYPLLFSLRFTLARASQGDPVTDIAEIVNSYIQSGFRGDERQEDYLPILGTDTENRRRTGGIRQPSESIKVLAQLSYLTATPREVTVSLVPSDAADLFDDLSPVLGRPLANGAEEIDRRAELFLSAMSDVDVETDYPHTALDPVGEAGFDGAFKEGRRVRHAHVSIERNRIVRDMFFKQNPRHSCDFCGMDTRLTYPWTDRLLEIHHLLPLCSGARTTKDGTLLDDLVANCPSCHRAVHRYYDKYLTQSRRADFDDANEARSVYESAKHRYNGWRT